MCSVANKYFILLFDPCCCFLSRHSPPLIYARVRAEITEALGAVSPLFISLLSELHDDEHLVLVVDSRF